MRISVAPYDSLQEFDTRSGTALPTSSRGSTRRPATPPPLGSRRGTSAGGTAWTPCHWVRLNFPSFLSECSRIASLCVGYRLDIVWLIELDFGSFQLVVKYPNPSRPYPPEPPCKLNLMSIDQTPERSINSFRTRCRRAGSASFGRRGGSATSTGAKTPRFSPPSRTDGSGLQQVILANSITS